MVQTVSLDTLLSSSANTTMKFSLKGLLSGHVGMFIAAPSVGKSHFSLCLAMEHSSSMTLLGMSAVNKPAKTLVVSSEDSAGIIQQRMKDKLINCPTSVRNELKQNLHFMTDIDPFVIPPDSSVREQSEHGKYLKSLIELFSQFDLVIIDTVTEAIGRCEEVKHDRLIKNVFQTLASQSGASLLLVHHINKDEIRGSQEITMASGAGLTSVMRLTKCLFTLKLKKEQLSVKYLKSNYLGVQDVTEFSVEIQNNLTVNPLVMSLKSKEKRAKSVDKKLEATPKSITLTGMPISLEETKERKNLRNVL